MLIKATLKDIETYGEFVYQLALDQAHSCYPTYADGIKTKEDFLADAVKGVTGNHSELLLFLSEETVEGWIRYYWLPEDHYLQLVACNIRNKTPQALSELMELLQERFSGYTLYFGFPGKNTEAICFLQAQGFKCVEDDWNYSFLFDRYELQPGDTDIARITRENFDDFRAVYHPEATAYWNCDHILETLEDWIIFVSYQKNAPVGTIFLRGNQGYYEIYNVAFVENVLENVFPKNVFRALLIAGLNACKRLSANYLTYLCDIEMAKPVLEECGFQCVGQYVLYIKML